MAPGKWTEDNEKRLLMAIIKQTGERTPNWNAIAAMMGDGWTSGAISQRYTKVIKKASYAQFGDAGASGESSPTKTPAKGGKKAGGEGATKSTGSKRKIQKDVGEDEDDEEQLKTPSKKIKAKKEEPKEESDEEFV